MRFYGCLPNAFFFLLCSTGLVATNGYLLFVYSRALRSCLFILICLSFILCSTLDFIFAPSIFDWSVRAFHFFCVAECLFVVSFIFLSCPFAIFEPFFLLLRSIYFVLHSAPEILFLAVLRYLLLPRSKALFSFCLFLCVIIWERCFSILFLLSFLFGFRSIYWCRLIWPFMMRRGEESVGRF